MKSRNKDWFHYCSYWGTENRCLQRMGGKFDQAIEVSVTPINPTFPDVWEMLGEVRIRYHGTTAGERDTFSHELNDVNEKILIEKVGPRITNILLHEDLLAEIDPVKLDKIQKAWRGGGGYPFILICKEPLKYLELIEVWKKKIDGKEIYGTDLFRDLFDLFDRETAKRKVEAITPKENGFVYTQ